MDYKVRFQEKEYYKVTLVSLNPDRCRILKGPEEEKRLVEVLLDDYQISRYEKMIQLVVREVVEESYWSDFYHIFSLKHLQEEFQKGTANISYSYLRRIDENMQMVTASVYPRKFGSQGQLEEFMMYVFIQR